MTTFKIMAYIVNQLKMAYQILASSKNRIVKGALQKSNACISAY